MINYFKSETGITLRQDANALFGFLPIQGVAFFAPREDYSSLIAYLSEKGVKPPRKYPAFKNNGFVFPLGNPRILGPSTWDDIPKADYPLVINWMITGQCNHQCSYCYAQDLMHSNEEEPSSEAQIHKIISTLKKMRPVAVVISGGEPTLSSFLGSAIEGLAQFTSVIVDTNNLNLKPEHITQLKKYKAHVRVSLDSLSMKHHCKNRPYKIKAKSHDNFEVIINNIAALSKAKIPMTINTVAAKSNYHDIHEFSQFFEKLSIAKHRIRLVEDSKNIKNFLKIRGNDKEYAGFVSRTLKRPGLLTTLRIPSERNSLVLVSPSGDYYTESQLIEQGKILIDPDTPKRPSKKQMEQRINMHAHSARYLLK